MKDKDSQERLRQDLQKNLRLHFFDDAEIDEIFRRIAAFGKLGRKVLALCFQLSNTSSDLVARTLSHIKKASLVFSPSELEAWLAKAFDLLDSSGLDAAAGFLSRSAEAELTQFKSCPAARLDDISRRLEIYLKGLSGTDFRVSASPGPAVPSSCHTDGLRIFLPRELCVFETAEKNLLLYRLMAVHKWAQAAEGTLSPKIEGLPEYPQKPAFPGLHELDKLMSHFKERQLALDLYNISESIRLDAFLERQVPGLYEKTQPLRMEFLARRILNPTGSLQKNKNSFVEQLFELYLATGRDNAPYRIEITEEAKKAWQGSRAGKTAADSARNLFSLYRLAGGPEGPHMPVDTLFAGVLRPDEIRRETERKAAAARKKFEDAISSILDMPDFEPGVFEREKPGFPRRTAKPGKTYLFIRGRLIELDGELLKNLNFPLPPGEKIPGGVLVDGAAAGGRAVYRLGDFAFEDDDSGGQFTESGQKGVKYDEWDYRRGGYRRGWCTLYEQDVHQGHEPFVEQTLKRYGGYITALKNRFELLRREPKLLRRQKDGDDIDIDAMVEAIADMHAGIPPSEKDLFVRYERKERDIAALFLLDMSGSTKGWVNQAEKESLVLMCEAMTALGDSYAIYGFSGMTRGRCEFYRIKNFDESYGEDVKKRIAGIEPKDYTRMGPAIRHSVSILGRMEARTKLLIVLSDGKPEDYDAYKGDYGVEDTRKALIEAKERGFHPFCITIDREARSYLPHMYGAANYIFIDEVKKLPDRMPEIYRRLTQ